MTNDTSPYQILKPKTDKLSPILISIPHAGLDFPESIRNQFKPQAVQQPEDTDWFVDRLYEFALNKGITLIKAKYSRYVIDLNRSPDDHPLYTDGRQLTSLIPFKTFSQKVIYKEARPSLAEHQQRLRDYYWPYYQGITEQLELLQQQFKHVLLFDAHSIKRYVPTISEEKFPSLILGNNNRRTANSLLIQAGLECLSLDNQFDISENKPFKGGHITRYFGKPDKNIHGLQLEMAQDVYMDEQNIKFAPDKAKNIQQKLSKMFDKFIEVLRALP